ncbi:unnamed protein product [Rotaria sp. Silwood2]|nr:unnamed protein product [Rotaria sp. Silwood2]
MTNLEELHLYFVNTYGSIIDGNNLENNIINHMTKLKKFTFNIRSVIYLDNQFNLPSNEDIKKTFKNFDNNQTTSYVDYFKKLNLFYCQIYSNPYRWTFYNNITNNFPGGLFKCVREISLHDEHPFEHDFFLRISKSFPFIKKLSLHNYEPQKNNYLQWPIIKYHHLIEIDLAKAHDDYVEQFLNNTKMCLLNNVHLRVRFDSLVKTTNNFTRDVTRINCTKINLKIRSFTVELSRLKEYFPHAKIY